MAYSYDYFVLSCKMAASLNKYQYGISNQKFSICTDQLNRS